MMEKCIDPEIGLLLHAYELHALTEEEEQRFEIHLLECQYCLQEFKAFETESVLMNRSAVLQDALRGLEAEPRRKTIWSKLWPEVPVLYRPALAYLLLLLMVYPTYRGLVLRQQGPEVRPEATAGELVRPVQKIDLVPARSSETKSFKLGAEPEGIINFVFRGAKPGESYQVVIETEEGKIIQQVKGYRNFDRNGTGTLSVSVRQMKAGTYFLTITDPRGEFPGNTQEYAFVIEE
jgi:hypothetical protein